MSITDALMPLDSFDETKTFLLFPKYFDSKKYRKQLLKYQNESLSFLMGVLPSIYNTSHPSTRYALTLKMYARELARLRIFHDQVQDDNYWDICRGEYLYQNIGYLLFLPSIIPFDNWSDEDYRKFILGVVSVYLNGSKLESIQKACELLVPESFGVEVREAYRDRIEGKEDSMYLQIDPYTMDKSFDFGFYIRVFLDDQSERLPGDWHCDPDWDSSKYRESDISRWGPALVALVNNVRPAHTLFRLNLVRDLRDCIYADDSDLGIGIDLEIRDYCPPGFLHLLDTGETLDIQDNTGDQPPLLDSGLWLDGVFEFDDSPCLTVALDSGFNFDEGTPCVSFEMLFDNGITLDDAYHGEAAILDADRFSWWYGIEVPEVNTPGSTVYNKYDDVYYGLDIGSLFDGGAGLDIFDVSLDEDFTLDPTIIPSVHIPSYLRHELRYGSPVWVPTTNKEECPFPKLDVIDWRCYWEQKCPMDDIVLDWDPVYLLDNGEYFDVALSSPCWIYFDGDVCGSDDVGIDIDLGIVTDVCPCIFDADPPVLLDNFELPFIENVYAGKLPEGAGIPGTGYDYAGICLFDEGHFSDVSGGLDPSWDDICWPDGRCTHLDEGCYPDTVFPIIDTGDSIVDGYCGDLAYDVNEYILDEGQTLDVEGASFDAIMYTLDVATSSCGLLDSYLQDSVAIDLQKRAKGYMRCTYDNINQDDHEVSAVQPGAVGNTLLASTHKVHTFGSGKAPGNNADGASSLGSWPFGNPQVIMGQTQFYIDDLNESFSGLPVEWIQDGDFIEIANWQVLVLDIDYVNKRIFTTPYPLLDFYDRGIWVYDSTHHKATSYLTAQASLAKGSTTQEQAVDFTVHDTSDFHVGQVVAVFCGVIDPPVTTTLSSTPTASLLPDTVTSIDVVDTTGIEVGGMVDIPNMIPTYEEGKYTGSVSNWVASSRTLSIDISGTPDASSWVLRDPQTQDFMHIEINGGSGTYSVFGQITSVTNPWVYPVTVEMYVYRHTSDLPNISIGDSIDTVKNFFRDSTYYGYGMSGEVKSITGTGPYTIEFADIMPLREYKAQSPYDGEVRLFPGDVDTSSYAEKQTAVDGTPVCKIWSLNNIPAGATVEYRGKNATWCSGLVTSVDSVGGIISVQTDLVYPFETDPVFPVSSSIVSIEGKMRVFDSGTLVETWDEIGFVDCPAIAPNVDDYAYDVVNAGSSYVQMAKGPDWDERAKFMQFISMLPIPRTSLPVTDQTRLSGGVG